MSDQVAEQNAASANALGSAQSTETDTDNNEGRDFEAEAKEMGWVPKDDYKGPEDKWRPAEEFVKRGEEILPIVQATNKRLKAELDKKEADFAKRLQKMERMNQSALDAQKKQFEGQIEDIKAKQRQAVDDGDVAAYDALEKKKEELQKSAPGEEPAEDNETVQKDWVTKNDWYRSDFKLAAEAEQYSQWLAAQNPGITLADNLEKTEAYIKEQHPEKFGGKPKKPGGHAAVDGGGAFPGGATGGKKTYADLPAEAKAACDQFVADKIMSKEDYVKDYFNDEK